MTTSEEDCEFKERVASVAERERKANILLDNIIEQLPQGLNGLVVMVNADTGTWFNTKDHETGWMEAKQRWGEHIAHPPVWTIDLAKVYTEREKLKNAKPAS